ncbi:MAG: hypothetical protein K0R27_3623 [Xanthobacteraceae bacterium]|jgi:hypothetical protein|nr:hypothetical protein [Xanthobacteraceae bacterium]
MSARRFMMMICAAWLLSAAPAAAAVSDREPASGALWLAVIAVASMSWVMACRRWWLPLLIWGPIAFLASELIAELGDPVIGPAVRDELGAGYVLQADLCSALLVVMPLLLANIQLGRHSSRWPGQTER